MTRPPKADARGERDEAIRKHYLDEAERHGQGAASTMDDEIIRARELEMIRRFLQRASGLQVQQRRSLRVLDLGCGNGYALAQLAPQWPRHEWHGLDFVEAMLELARARRLPGVELRQGDARAMPYEDSFFDAVYSERCLINLLTWEDQVAALRELGRVVRPGGHVLMIECFTDGLENNNRARAEFGLEPLAARHHNLYFDKAAWRGAIEPHFDVLQPDGFDPEAPEHSFAFNFLSSHYYVARVLHPVLAPKSGKNSEFVKFLACLPPSGNYGALQAFVLRRRGG